LHTRPSFPLGHNINVDDGVKDFIHKRLSFSDTEIVDNPKNGKKRDSTDVKLSPKEQQAKQQQLWHQQRGNCRIFFVERFRGLQSSRSPVVSRTHRQGRTTAFRNPKGSGRRGRSPGSPRIVVLTHLDMVPKAASATWRKAYDTLGAERWDEAPINRQVANQAKQARDIRSRFDNDGNAKKKSKWKNASFDDRIETENTKITPVEQVLFVNAKQGQGIHALHRAIFKAGAHVQERRERRGLNPRPLRVGIIGYPNVGKVRA
jgi:hypothetical protein